MRLFPRRPAGAPTTTTAPSERDSVLDVPATPGLKPSAMRGNEALYGYMVGVVLVVVAVLNLAVTSGPGAPAHPDTILEGIGVAASLALFGAVRTGNRMVAGFGAIVAAFFVTLPRVPNSLSIAHIVALVVPMVFGLVITQRQRKDTPRMARGGRAAAAGAAKGSGRSGGSRAGAVPAGGRRGRRGKAAEPVSGPRPSARYTPPKAKREQKK